MDKVENTMNMLSDLEIYEQYNIDREIKNMKLLNSEMEEMLNLNKIKDPSILISEDFVRNNNMKLTYIEYDGRVYDARIYDNITIPKPTEHTPKQHRPNSFCDATSIISDIGNMIKTPDPLKIFAKYYIYTNLVVDLNDKNYEKLYVVISKQDQNKAGNNLEIQFYVDEKFYDFLESMSGNLK